MDEGTASVLAAGPAQLETADGARRSLLAQSTDPDVAQTGYMGNHRRGVAEEADPDSPRVEFIATITLGENSACELALVRRGEPQ